MTGGGIERVLRIASAALTGRPSRRSAIPGATGCPRGGHRLSHGRSCTRCLAALPPPERYKGRHSPSIDRLRWAENRSLRSVFTLLRIEGRPISAADALRRARSIPPPVMLFLRSAYLACGQTPRRGPWPKPSLLAQCLRSWLFPRAHLSRRPSLSEPRHHRSSRRAVRAA